MTDRDFTRYVFLLAAITDGLVGAILFFIPSWFYRQFNIALPAHLAYVQFPGAVFMIFAAMFYSIAREPGHYRHMIPYGIAMKAAYCVLALWYEMSTGIPNLWKTCAIFDLMMILLFAWAYVRIP